MSVHAAQAVTRPKSSYVLCIQARLDSRRSSGMFQCCMNSCPNSYLRVTQQDKCDRKLSTGWQRALHFITEKSTEPQLYLEQIEDLNACHPDWPFALVRLGKAYLLLEDLHRALEIFEKALSLLSPVKDEIFAQYVRGLRAYITVTSSRSVLLYLPVCADEVPFLLGPRGRRRYLCSSNIANGI